MSLRVIAGQARGMKLKPVPGDRTRPIMDRVKEALFSIIGTDIRGAHFVDLFAGTGSVGIEALSRGAAFALFIDLNRRAVKIVQENLAHTRLESRGRVIRRDALQIVAKPPERHFDFIYVAPPQYKNLWLNTLNALDANAAWHRLESTIIVQIDPEEYEVEHEFGHLEETDKRLYGRTMLVFYRFRAHRCAAADENGRDDHT